jgi:diguanylate cyclase (GGDEF)-like protein/PAS domain S-box-containing protein
MDQEELTSIFKNLQEVYYRIDSDGKIERVSDSVFTLLGYTTSELVGQKMADIYVKPDGREKFLQAINAAGGRIFNQDVLLKHKKGKRVWASTSAHILYDENNEPNGIEGIARNVTELKSHVLQLNKLTNVLNHTADMVMVTNTNGIIEYVNQKFESVTGYSSEEVCGKYPSILASGKQPEKTYQELWKTIKSGHKFETIFINKRKDGSLYYEEKTISPLADDMDNIIYYISTSKDITKRIESEKKLAHLAHHDALTGLPNRTQIINRLNQALYHAEIHNRLIAVMFIDLDRFKEINDTYGHNVGDELLIQLTERLSRSVRSEDTVGRYAGDEFVILLDDIDNEHHISILAQKLVDTLNEAFIIYGRKVKISASIGVSFFPTDGKTTNILIRNADIAMYRAKEIGKNAYQFYSNDLSAKIFERLTLESHLRHALEKNEFVLYYQPQVDLRTNHIISVEALIRWQHPYMGLVPPNNFISLLEETGLIESVGNWIIRTACQQLKHWHDLGLNHLHMSINLSSRQFNNPELFDNINEIIRNTQVNPEYLEFEITESMLMRKTSSIVSSLQSLSTLGIHFAIDDFGTGYSSLSYLRRFPIDTIKIDKSFIRDIPENEDDAAITKAIIGLAKSLSLKVIAEGVENNKQLDFLEQNECNYIQGYYFWPPVQAGEITGILQQQLIS